jgi:hypothetical protein
MNAHARNIKPAPLVALPHPNETAMDQACRAMSLLRSAMALASGGEQMDAEEKGDMMVLVESAYHILEPIVGFLAVVADDDASVERFRDARREWVLSRQGGAA